LSGFPFPRENQNHLILCFHFNPFLHSTLFKSKRAGQKSRVNHPYHAYSYIGLDHDIGHPLDEMIVGRGAKVE
ncbi:MAG: hypothetical protein ACI97X_000362, partial [Oceanospirillaceae bacterium]